MALPEQQPGKIDYKGTKTMDLLQYISLGFFAMWFIFGIPLSFYVRSQTLDAASKWTFCQ